MGNAQTTTKPRIYVACLAAYNSGILHGEWIGAEGGEDEVRAQIARMLAASPIPNAEEYAIHDYEGFEGATIEEYSGIGRVCELAGFIAEHGELGGAVLSHFGGDLDEARDALEDRYLGRYSSLADYMEGVTEETIKVPDALRYYIDYEAMARDADINGDVFTVQLGYHEVHVFSGY
jgi:antirestriction protein